MRKLVLLAFSAFFLGGCVAKPATRSVGVNEHYGHTAQTPENAGFTMRFEIAKSNATHISFDFDSGSRDTSHLRIGQPLNRGFIVDVCSLLFSDAAGTQLPPENCKPETGEVLIRIPADGVILLGLKPGESRQLAEEYLRGSRVQPEWHLNWVCAGKLALVTKWGTAFGRVPPGGLRTVRVNPAKKHRSC